MADKIQWKKCGDQESEHEKKFYRGVYFYEKVRQDKKCPQKDKYFAIGYQVNKKRHFFGLGWQSDGWSADKAKEKRDTYLANAKNGVGPISWQEEIAENQRRKEQEEKEAAERARREVTFSWFWENEYFPSRKLNKAPGTYKTEMSYYNKWLKPELEDRKLVEITASDIENVVYRMKREKKSKKTQHHVYAIIRHVFNTATKKKRFDGDNPINDVEKISFDNRKDNYFEPEQAKKLLDAIYKKSPKWHDICLLALNTGMRANEIFTLTWRDINFSANDITVQSKNAKSRRKRHIPMTADAKDLLEKLHENRMDDNLIFRDSDGEQIREVSKTVGRTIQELGFNEDVTETIYKLTFHSLRHTYATWYLQNGGDIYTLSHLLGHSTIKLTERYSHHERNHVQRSTINFPRINSSGKVLPFNQAAAN
jgi:integrase